MKTSYRERNYEYGTTMITLRTAIGLTQAELANVLGVSRLTVARWEAGINYPKTEHLKKLIALAVESQAFPKGSELVEIRALWKATQQRVRLDEYWLSELLSQGSCTDPDVGQGADRGKPYPIAAPTSVEDGESVPGQGVEAIPSDQHSSNEVSTGEENRHYIVPIPRRDRGFAHPSDPFPDEKPLSAPTNHPVLSPLDARSVETTGLVLSLPNGQMGEGNRSNKTRGWRKWLLPILIALVVLTIIGSAGTFFFSARDHTIDPMYPGYLLGKGQLVFFDPLSKAGDSSWNGDLNSTRNSATGATCQFTGGAYHVIEPNSNNEFRYCYANGIFSNFAFEVQSTVDQGDCGGILFRNDTKGHDYEFYVCQDGGYEVDTDSTILNSNRSSFINTGLNRPNKIAVVASGNIMTFYVNEQQIDQIQDSSYTSGKIALIADAHNHPTDVTYRNARLWTL